MCPMSIGERLKEARLRVHETGVQFSRRFGVDQSLYHRWERGQRNPSSAAQSLIERILAELAVKSDT